jgi:beta-galactosidase
MVANANNAVRFTLTGPGKIIGVGNGDPTSHEPDRFFESVKAIKIEELKEIAVDHLDKRPEVAPGLDDSHGNRLIIAETTIGACMKTPPCCSGTVLQFGQGQWLTFYKKHFRGQSIYLNGHLIAAKINATIIISRSASII